MPSLYFDAGGNVIGDPHMHQLQLRTVTGRFVNRSIATEHFRYGDEFCCRNLHNAYNLSAIK